MRASSITARLFGCNRPDDSATTASGSDALGPRVRPAAEPKTRRRHRGLDGAKTSISLQALGYGRKTSRGMVTAESPTTQLGRSSWRDLPKTSNDKFSGHFANSDATSQTFGATFSDRFAARATTGLPGISLATADSDLAVRNAVACDAHLEALFGRPGQPRVATLRSALLEYSERVPERPYLQVFLLANALAQASKGDAGKALDILHQLPHMQLDQAQTPENDDVWQTAMVLATTPEGVDCFLHVKDLVDVQHLNGAPSSDRAFASLAKNGFDPASGPACEAMLWRTLLKAKAQVEIEPKKSSPSLAARCIEHIEKLAAALPRLREEQLATPQDRIDHAIEAAGGDAAYADLRAYQDGLGTDDAVKKAGRWLKRYVKWLQRCEKINKSNVWDWTGPVRNVAVGSSPLHSIVKLGDGGFALKHSGEEMHGIHNELMTSMSDLVRAQLELNLARPSAQDQPSQILEWQALSTVLQAGTAWIDSARRQELPAELSVPGITWPGPDDSPRKLSALNARWLQSDQGRPCLDAMCTVVTGKLSALGIEAPHDDVANAILQAASQLSPTGMAAVSASLPAVADETVSEADKQACLAQLNSNRKFMPVVNLAGLGEHVQGRMQIAEAMRKGDVRPATGNIEDVTNYFVRAMRWHQDNSLTAEDGARGGIANIAIPVPVPVGPAMLFIRPTIVGDKSESFSVNADNDATRLNIGVSRGMQAGLGAIGGYGWESSYIKGGVFLDGAVEGEYKQKKGLTVVMRRDFTLASPDTLPTAKVANASYEGMETGSHRVLSMSFFRFAEKLARNPTGLSDDEIVAARRARAPAERRDEIRQPGPDRLNPFADARLSHGERKALRAPGREHDLKQLSSRKLVESFYMDPAFRYRANQVGLSLSQRTDKTVDVSVGVSARVQLGSTELPGARHQNKESLYAGLMANLIQAKVRLVDKTRRKDEGFGAFEQKVDRKGLNATVTSSLSASAWVPSPIGNKDMDKGRPVGVVGLSGQITWYDRQLTNMVRVHRLPDGRIDSFHTFRGTNATRFTDFKAEVMRHKVALSALLGGDEKLDDMLQQIENRFPGGDVSFLIRWRLTRAAGRGVDALEAQHKMTQQRLNLLQTELNALNVTGTRNTSLADANAQRATLQENIAAIKLSLTQLAKKRDAVLQADDSYEPYGIGVTELNQDERQSGLLYFIQLAGRKSVSANREVDWATSAAREGTHADNFESSTAASEADRLRGLAETPDADAYLRFIRTLLQRGRDDMAEQAIADFRTYAGGDNEAAAAERVRNVVDRVLGSKRSPKYWSEQTVAWLQRPQDFDVATH